RSSSRSAVVRPPSPAPISRAACLIQVPIVMAEGPNSLDRDAAVRPDRASATICRLNSGVYRTVLSAIVNSSCYNGEVSTKAGQLHTLVAVNVVGATLNIVLTRLAIPTLPSSSLRAGTRFPTFGGVDLLGRAWSPTDAPCTIIRITD